MPFAPPSRARQALPAVAEEPRSCPSLPRLPLQPGWGPVAGRRRAAHRVLGIRGPFQSQNERGAGARRRWGGQRFAGMAAPPSESATGPCGVGGIWRGSAAALKAGCGGAGVVGQERAPDPVAQAHRRPASIRPGARGCPWPALTAGSGSVRLKSGPERRTKAAGQSGVRGATPLGDPLPPLQRWRSLRASFAQVPAGPCGPPPSESAVSPPPSPPQAHWARDPSEFQ